MRLNQLDSTKRSKSKNWKEVIRIEPLCMTSDRQRRQPARARSWLEATGGPWPIWLAAGCWSDSHSRYLISCDRLLLLRPRMISATWSVIPNSAGPILNWWWCHSLSYLFTYVASYNKIISYHGHRYFKSIEFDRRSVSFLSGRRRHILASWFRL